MTLDDKIVCINYVYQRKSERFQSKFTTLLNKFKIDTKLIEELQVNVYVNSLPTPISMFIKREGKLTLEENFKEAKKVEFEMLECKEKTNKMDSSQTKKGIILEKPQNKATLERKEIDSMDLENL
jgi:hypothetical protein